MLSLFFSSSESVGEPYPETLQITNITFNLKCLCKMSNVGKFSLKTQLIKLANLQHISPTAHN